ncbi:hypothetical protein F511_30734 [Dorcoceras hygrometricum]|uniref:Uncharacterized protein n=1 Tax=Dorcoceras hygrometricum TaxID=472368 RepID=A0A2Z7AVM1_9LAMI|nr:hypothetical protein F511_30734 [Dorcoceras hygrometricum]
MVATFRSDATIPNSSQRSRHKQVYCFRKTDSVGFRVRRLVHLLRSAQGFGPYHVLETSRSRLARRPSLQCRSSQLTRSTQLVMVKLACDDQLSSWRSTQLATVNSVWGLDTAYDLKQLAIRPFVI